MPDFKYEDQKYMQLAVDLSKKGLGTTSPNPVVGSVIVKNGTVVGTGFHKKAGGSHAEILAIKEAGEKAKNSTVYVTLEPCSIFGKTPPCTDAILNAGVKKVVIATQDPNEKVSGRGIEILKENGVEVEVGVMKRKAEFVNRYYLTYQRKNRPYITLKLATTLDGRIADINGDSKWITSNESRSDVQELRRVHDAVLVGEGTLIKDNPILTYRGKKEKTPPLKRIVVGSKSGSIGNPELFKTDSNGEIIFAVPGDINEAKERTLKNLGAEVIKTKNNPRGRVEFFELFQKLAEREVQSVLVEGGAKVFSCLLQKLLFDELIIYYAPAIFGGGLKFVEFEPPGTVKKHLQLEPYQIKTINDDLKVTLFRREVIAG